MSMAHPTTGFVHLEERDDVAFITLDRPPLNVLSIAMMGELRVTLAEATRHLRARAVVLRGAGTAFSAGADVGEHRGGALRSLLENFNGVILDLVRSPIPVIAAVHGAALGGGCELAMAADMVLVAEDAQLGVPEIKLGGIPPAAAILLPRLIGTHRGLELILTGEPISGTEAARIGLVNRAVPIDALDSALEELLDRLRANSAAALRVARRAVVESVGKSVAQALADLELLQLRELVPSHDAREGIRAFQERRAPVWEHR